MIPNMAAKVPKKEGKDDICDMKKKLEIRRTAHYHVQEGKDSKKVLYLIHGYGQLASDFLLEFQFLKELNVTIVAPEAISKFYNKERKAVANWMTSHEREDEINDYVNYLNDLHEAIQEEYKAEEYSILAFSQGTSTAFRWIAANQSSFRKAYICSGAIPPEIGEDDLRHHKACDFIYFYGDNDRLIEEEKSRPLIERFKTLVNQLEVIQFNGGHIISDECKQLLYEQFN